MAATSVNRAARRTRAPGAALSVVLVLAGSAAGPLATPVSAASATASVPTAAPGVGQSVPHPGSSSSLIGLACPSPRSCWAVGSYDTINGAVLNQALHWNGRKWSLVTTPSPGGTTPAGFSELVGVSCASSASCWAVGLYSNGNGVTLNQALHWNGRKWSKASTPSPGGTVFGDLSELIGVRCRSLTSCWSVGVFTNGNGASLNQALHWNGRKWSVAATPDPAGTGAGAVNALTDVSCPSSASCWAVGSYGTNGNPGTELNQVLHWNGRRWLLVTTPDPGGAGSGARNSLSAVACPSSASCWAVGTYGTLGTVSNPGTELNQALHWNGRKWSLAATPDPARTGEGAGNSLRAITCTSSANCWAVGTYLAAPGGAAFLNEALHWNGRTWSLVATPDAGGTASNDLNRLEGIRCTSPASCWAVGEHRTSPGAFLNQVLHWNGTSWSSV